MIGRRRFADVVRRQLNFFEREHAGLLRRAAEAERAYVAADREDAEERYGDLVDIVDEGTEALAEVRDHYAATLDDATAEEYAAAFNRAVRKRFRRFALEIEDT
jgi:hypothetical protein